MAKLHPDVEQIRAIVEDAAVELAGNRSTVPVEADPFGDADDGTRAFVFGSSANGFGTTRSDVDVVVRGAPWSLSLENLRVALEQRGFVILEHRVRARVPVLVCKYDGRSVDVSLNNLLPLTNTFWLRAHAECDRRVREYVVRVQEWTKGKRITDASQGFYSSYAWTLIALFVLKYRNILSAPSINQIVCGVQPKIFSRASGGDWFFLFIATLRDLVSPPHVLHPESGRIERHTRLECKEPFVLMDPWEERRNLGDSFGRRLDRFEVPEPLARKGRVLRALGLASPEVPRPIQACDDKRTYAVSEKSRDEDLHAELGHVWHRGESGVRGW